MFKISRLYLMLSVLVSLNSVAQCEKKIFIDKPGNYKLPNDCRGYSGVIISSSNVHLDCNGQLINGEGKEKIGVLIGGTRNKIFNVSIKNCKVENFSTSGLRVSSGIKLDELSTSIPDNYSKAPEDIEIENVIIKNGGSVGLFIDSYSQRVTISSSTIEGSVGVGVYFEQASRFNILKDSIISFNGKGKGREGVAIDSSSNNKIISNEFESNGAGGVFLYKNCGESFPGKASVARWQHSNGNIIGANSFINEKVGVWLASRKTRDLSAWGCSDKPYSRDKSYYPDYADFNHILNNRFNNTNAGIIIEGNNNVISENVFYGNSKVKVWLKENEVKKLTGDDLVGNVIK